MSTHGVVLAAIIRTWRRIYGYRQQDRCDECGEPMYQMVADTTKDPTEYRRHCERHMEKQGPYPVEE